MSTVTWSGAAGPWATALNWAGFVQPGPADDAVLNAGTATLEAPATVHNVTLAPASTADLQIESALTLNGTLRLAGGTLDLGPGGTIEGGTLDLAGGKLLTGGTVDGSVILGGFGFGLTVTTATVADSQPASTTLDVTGAINLAAGTYDAGTLNFNAFTTGRPEGLSTAAGVVFGAAETLIFSQTDPLHTPGTPPILQPMTFTAAGTTVSRGLIYSEVVNSSLTLSGAGFQNTGRIVLATSPQSGIQRTFKVGSGRHIEYDTVTYTQTWTPGLAVAATSFDNTGTIVGSAATLTETGTVFHNEGVIAFTDAQGQAPVVTATTAYVGAVTLSSFIAIGASVTDFANTGAIAAGTIAFADNLTLSQLGAVRGHLVFSGTLDLQSGTLDLSTYGGSSFSFTGTVENGTVVINGAAADFSEATLLNATTLAVAPLLDIVSGSVTLDAVRTELAYTTAASVDHLDVTAGALGTVDRIGARAAGTLTFGVDTAVTDVVAGSTLAIGGIGVFSDAGQIVLDAASLVVATTLDGAGTISLADGASLSIAALASTAATTIVFGPGHNLLSLPADLSGRDTLNITLIGLAIGDLIDFAGVSANAIPGGPFVQAGADIAGHTLEVTGASGAHAQVFVASAQPGITFTVAGDAAGGTLVTVACFCTGTRIAVADGERPVEALRIGDRVRTASGALRQIKWLGRRAYPASLVAEQKQLRPVRIAAGALGGGLPTRELFVSPLHAMLLDGVLVPAAALVNGAGIDRAPVGPVSYIHIELDSPDLILAEGAATETFVDCDSRAMFDNAAEFASLYADTPAQSWTFPVPRLEEGWRLDAIRRRLAVVADTPPGPLGGKLGGKLGGPLGGKLRGSIDRADGGRIEGWLLDDADPDNPVEFELLANDRQIGCLVANRYRIDLDRAGLGRGACAFTADLPPDVTGAAALQLRRLSDGATLGG